jgi:hypothetical protein
MDKFRFSPELFGMRASVLETLRDAGFEWLSHFLSVNPLHDVFGVEVCGIMEESDAREILRLVRSVFPHWGQYDLYLKDYGIEPGWKVKVHRDDEPGSENWETA